MLLLIYNIFSSNYPTKVYTNERIIFNLSRKIGQELLEELLPLIDDKLKKERKRGELSNQDKRLRYMTTLLGDILLNLPRFTGHQVKSYN